MRPTLLLAALLLTSCATVPPPLPGGPYCVSVKESGRCKEWVFGPSRIQREQFDKRSAK